LFGRWLLMSFFPYGKETQQGMSVANSNEFIESGLGIRFGCRSVDGITECFGLL